MIKRKEIRTAIVLFVAVCAVGIFYVSSAKAIIAPRGLRIFRIFALSSPIDLTPQIIKTTYSDAGRSTKEMNFEKGDTVYAKIEIYDPNPQGENLFVTDRVFNFQSGSFSGFTFTKSDGSTQNDNSSPALNKNLDEKNNKIEFSINVGEGVNKIEYEYKAGD